MYDNTMLSRLLESTDLPCLTRFVIVLWTSMQYEYIKKKKKIDSTTFKSGELLDHKSCTIL